MKQPRKLTRNEKETLTAYNLNSNEYVFIKDVGDSYIQVMHKVTGKTKILDKYRRKSKWQ